MGASWCRGGAALALAAVLLSGCGGGNWGWYVVSPMLAQGRTNLFFMMSGVTVTLQVSIAAIAISVVLGLIVALPAFSSKPPVRLLNRVYVDFIRAIPLLPLIFWVTYGMPVLLGVSLDRFWAGVLALALSDSAFQAEVFRAGIQSVPKGQTEAARTIGLSRLQTLRYVILPQAIRRILPALGNQFVYVLKMSALVSVIGLEDLTRYANDLTTTEYRPLEIYSVLILEYLVLILLVSQGVRWLERRMATSER